jgi:cystathionine gamma-synthase
MSQSQDRSLTNKSFGELKSKTRVVAAGRPSPSADGDINPSISLSSTYHAPNGVGYGRYGNDTWTALEEAISSLEGGKTLLFSSGMAAISAVFAVLPRGAVVTASKNGYSGTMSLLKKLEAEERIEVRYVDVSNTPEVLTALQGTVLLWLESPTNPALEVADMPTIIGAAKSIGCGVGVDNTFATALNQQPLDMGADISMNSVTKFIAGHSDVLMGSLSTADEALFNRLEDQRKLGGAIAGPFEAWLALRGLRTLALRLHQSQASALELAQRLSTHPKIARVRYPGLPTDPHHATAAKFMSGFGAVLSFEIHGSPEDADKVCSSSRLISQATSLGGVESLWERRHRWAAESPTIPKNLVRLSVGIEDVEDLWADIEHALAEI